MRILKCTYSHHHLLCVCLSLPWKYFIVVLINIFLVVNDVERLLICLLAICLSSWRNVYSDHLPVLKKGLCIFLSSSCYRSLWTLDPGFLSDRWFVNIFFPICRLSFYVTDGILWSRKPFNNRKCEKNGGKCFSHSYWVFRSGMCCVLHVLKFFSLQSAPKSGWLSP